MQTLPFGWPIVFYLTLAALASGNALFALWALFTQHNRENAWHALFITNVLMILGALCLVIDLENPQKFWYILYYFNPQSVIAWGARFVALFVIFNSLLVLFCYFSTQDYSFLHRCLFGIVAILAICIGFYPGLVLYQAAGEVLWSTMLLALLFFVSAIHCGWACIGPWITKNVSRYKRWEFFLIGSYAILVTIYVLWSYQKSPQVVSNWLYGKEALILWGGIYLAGVLLPLSKGMSQGGFVFRCGCVGVTTWSLRALVVMGTRGLI